MIDQEIDENWQKLFDYTMKILEAINRVDDTLSRITFPILKRILATRGVDMYKVESLGEQLVVNNRISAILADAAKIQIPEGDLSEGLLSEREWHPDSRIRVKKVPRGEAPKKFRQSQVGLEMDAFRLPEELNTIEHGLVSGEKISPRKGNLYAVRRDEFLAALQEKSPEAADWFRTHLRPETKELSYTANEVKVICRLPQP